MKVRITSAFVLALTVATAAGSAEDSPPFYPQPQQVGYQDCVTHCCKLVPETKQIKKTVYEIQEVPYCLKKLPPLWSLFHHRGCECAACVECQCPRYKKVLVKREVMCEEICTSKCVVKKHVEHMPCHEGCSK